MNYHLCTLVSVFRNKWLLPNEVHFSGCKYYFSRKRKEKQGEVNAVQRRHQ